MQAIHELLGKDVDPIDDVRRRFEDFYTNGTCRDPRDGDWWSDDYLQLINLATQGTPLSEEEAGMLTRRINRFNSDDRLPHICEMLFDRSDSPPTALFDAYNDVVEQVNKINTDDPKRTGIPIMEKPPYKEPMSRETVFAMLVAAVSQEC